MLDRIGKYKVEKELGQGGFGRVYLAFDPDVGQPVAIKKLLAGGDADLLKRFQLEIRTTASLRHKNIVAIYASGEEGGDPYLVMEYLEGLTLKQIIQGRRALNLLEKVRIIIQIADGLGYANSKGVVHRDVKPENIMLLADDTVKIMDFGIALGPNRNTAVTQTGGIIGTPPYFSPEQLKGAKANEQTDIFSFGDVCYELLGGVHPFEQYKGDWKSLQIAIISYEPRPIGDVVKGCPEALETLVQRALAKEPEFRYQSFKEIQLDGEAILVDLRHEGAADILREIPALTSSGNYTAALSRINQAYELDPGNREVRRLREEINQLVQKEHVQGRVAKVLAEADKYMEESRFAEAVECLEFGVKLDSTNRVLTARLQAAKSRQESYLRTNRLVSEARFLQQKGMLPQSQARLQEALELDPEHTEAKRLSQRVREELDRRRIDQEREQALGSARDHHAAKRFTEALKALDSLGKDPAAEGEVAALRSAIERDQAEEERRLRVERFQLAVDKTRETLESGDLERAGSMVARLEASFGQEPGEAEALRALRDQLRAGIRTQEIAQYHQQVQRLLKEKSLREALDVLQEALGKFPGDSGLEQARTQADELYRAQQRAEAVARVLKQAATMRQSGDAQGALREVAKARQKFGDESALVDLAHQLEGDIEKQRYQAGLETLLRESRKLIVAGNYASAVDRLTNAGEYAGEAEVRLLLNAARAAAAQDAERRLVEEVLAEAGKLQAAASWSEALKAVERGQARYPHNTTFSQLAQKLRQRMASERALAIEGRRTAIAREIENRQWDRAEALLADARAEFPGESIFDELAGRMQSSRYEDGWQKLHAKVQADLAGNSVSGAEEALRDQATYTLFAGDARWKNLAGEVARRREYEDALAEAGRRQEAGRLSEAEELLTAVINQGPPDKRAAQLQSAIQGRRSEAARQQEIARLAAGIRECLERNDLARAQAELAAARSRYPGEEAWAALQSLLDARQEAADLAASQAAVQQALDRNDLRQASAILNAARARFRGEGRWDALEAAIEERRAEENRAAEIAALAGKLRQSLELETWDEAAARRDLAAARTRYPGEPAWDAIEAEISARRDFQTAVRTLEDGVRRCLDRGDSAAARSELAAAKARYPQAPSWGALEAEIARREAVAGLASRVRDLLTKGDAAAARQQLDAARARYPQEDIWAALQSEVDARLAETERQAIIAAAAESVRGRLDREIREALSAGAPAGAFPIVKLWEILHDVRARVANASASYPGDPIWKTLDHEIAQRQAGLQAEIARAVPACQDLAALDWMAGQLVEARTRYPGEPFWDDLRTAIEANRSRLRTQAEVAAVERVVREELARVVELSRQPELTDQIVQQWEALQKAVTAATEALSRLPGNVRLAALQSEVAASRAEWIRPFADPPQLHASQPRPNAWFNNQIRALRKKDPREPLWARLEDAIAQQEARARRADEIAAASAAVRQSVQQDELGEAEKQLREARKKHGDDPLWPELAAEIGTRRREIEQIVEQAGGLLGQARFADAVALLEGRPTRDARGAPLLAQARRGLEEQRQREAREHTLARLVEIQGLAAAETRKRKRRDYDREAQQLASGYLQDVEIAGAAARVRALLETPAETVVRKPLPWKPVAAVAGAAVLVLATFWWMHKPKAPVVVPTVSKVPVEIRSDPPGAQVHLGDHTCITPACQFDLPPGDYQVDAQLSGYTGKKQTITASASRRVYDIELDPLPPPPKESTPGAAVGTLVVSAGLPGALISVDGKQLARTEESGSKTLSLEADRHEVLVEKNGYQKPAAQQVRIAAGAQRTLAFHLEPLPARLEVDGAPKDVRVTVGGVALGPTDGSPAFLFAGSVPTGDQTVEVTSGSGRRTVPHHFTAGDTERLKWPDIAPAAPLPPPPPVEHKPSTEEIEARDWDSVSNASDVAPLRKFLEAHPKGGHAGQAEARIADVTWQKVDKTKSDAIRQYLRDNPNSPHRDEADNLARQLDRAKDEAAKQALAKQESDRQARVRQQILEAVQSLSAAFGSRKDAAVRKIWPDVSRAFLEDMKNSKISFNTNEQDIQIQPNGEATVMCNFVTANPQRKPPIESHLFTFTFRLEGTIWTVVSAHQ